ncbi:MAG: alanine racemase, partial [Methanocorpusculum sp.]|nr:alanine racemase [Methanocorpusculum sp.]
MNHPADSYYLYDETILLEQLSILQKAFPQCRLFYSAKTNPNKHILKTLTGHGCGIDAASAHEVLLAAGLHLSAGDISYSAPGKTKEDIEETLGRCRIVADSLSELKRIDAAAKERGIIADISLRINPDFGMYETSGTPSPFGIDEENLPEALSCIAGLPNLRATGIHVHIRSQILDSLVLARYFENVFRLAEKMQSAGFAVRVINFGSGLGIVYDPAAERPLDMQMLSAKMAELTEKYNTSL